MARKIKKNSGLPLAYLSGAMEGAPNLGRNWRRRMRRFLEGELKHCVFDPTENISRLLSANERRNFRQWKLNAPDKFFPVIRRIIDNDLKILTTETDYVVCYWDEYVCHGAGTAAEISIAYMLGIPVYFITPLPFDKVSSWALGCATEIFTTFRQFYRFMRRANKHRGKLSVWRSRK
ncbi:MAG: hypothetical protein N2246_05420 [Candidatus Sumerlaeia bacterium]|nr:hypothetical protein [Candidatus Sumerlaeia bacterium]